jgi:hypothetical protein
MGIVAGTGDDEHRRHPVPDERQPGIEAVVAGPREDDHGVDPGRGLLPVREDEEDEAGHQPDAHEHCKNEEGIADHRDE